MVRSIGKVIDLVIAEVAEEEFQRLIRGVS